jgi:hypothetical protein
VRAALVSCAGAALVVGSVVVVRSIGSDASEGDASANHDGPAGLVRPGEPCSEAVHAKSPQELHADIPIYMPSDSYTLTDAWTCADTPVLLFGNIQVSYESGWEQVPVPDKWRDLAEDYGGHVDVISGRPALIQSSEETKDDNQVLVVVGDTLIRALALPDVPIGDLEALVASIDMTGKG